MYLCYSLVLLWVILCQSSSNSLVLLQGLLCQSSSIRNYSICNHIAIYVTVLCYYRGYYVRAVVFVIIVLVIIVIIQLLMYQSCVIIGNIMLEQQYFVKGTMHILVSKESKKNFSKICILFLFCDTYPCNAQRTLKSAFYVD